MSEASQEAHEVFLKTATERAAMLALSELKAREPSYQDGFADGFARAWQEVWELFTKNTKEGAK